MKSDENAKIGKEPTPVTTKAYAGTTGTTLIATKAHAGTTDTMLATTMRFRDAMGTKESRDCTAPGGQGRAHMRISDSGG